MINLTKSFIDLCVEGTADPDDVDNYITYWHSIETNQSLQHFLGLTKEEYNDFLLDSSLKDVIENRKQNGYNIEDFREFKHSLNESLSKLMKKKLVIIAIDQEKNSIVIEYKEI